MRWKSWRRQKQEGDTNKEGDTHQEGANHQGDKKQEGDKNQEGDKHKHKHFFPPTFLNKFFWHLFWTTTIYWTIFFLQFFFTNISFYQSHQNGNVAKMEISPKLKCNKNWNEMSLKLKYQQN